MADESDVLDRGDVESHKSDKMFSLKKWNAVAMWSWDVECDTCAICRVQVMGKLHILCRMYEFDGYGQFSLLCSITYSCLIFIKISINRQLMK
jgi:RING-box protein 2